MNIDDNPSHFKLMPMWSDPIEHNENDIPIIYWQSLMNSSGLTHVAVAAIIYINNFEYEKKENPWIVEPFIIIY